MYHEAKTPFYRSYYDSIEEVPTVAKVYFPESKEPKEMSVEEMIELSDKGWYTIMHTVNYGCCDHWVSVPLSKWVKERFIPVVKYYSTDKKFYGYNRREWSVRLTRDSRYRRSEVWNS